MDKIKEKHVRFYIDLSDSDNEKLHQLASHLTQKMDVTITRGKAIMLAVKQMARKERL